MGYYARYEQYEVYEGWKNSRETPVLSYPFIIIADIFGYETLRVPHLPTVDSTYVRVNCGFKRQKVPMQNQISQNRSVPWTAGRRRRPLHETQPIMTLGTAVLIMGRRQSTTTHEFGERTESGYVVGRERRACLYGRKTGGTKIGLLFFKRIYFFFFWTK